MSNKENFLFLASWHDLIEGYEAAGKPDVASELAKQIIYYGVTGEMTTDDPVIAGTVMGMCSALIDKSKKRYNTCVANGRQGGRPKKYSVEDMIDLRSKGLSLQDIADNLGCSVKTVQRALAAVDADDDI